MQDSATSSGYRTLSDIRLRKAQLQTELTRDTNRARGIWEGIVHPKKTAGKSRGKFSAASLITTGAGVLDGALLAWKLYRKFGGKGIRLGRR